MKKIFISIFFIFAFILMFNQKIKAQENIEPKNYQGIVTQILEKKTSGTFNMGEMFQKLEIKITSKGELNQQLVVIDNTNPKIEYKINDKLMIYQADEKTFFIADQVRTNSLLILFTIFIGMVLFISKWQGLGSLIGMFFSFLVIIYFILPKIATIYGY